MIPAKGVHTPKIAPAPTLARMARAVNLPAEHLESEGHRPDAAKILRSIPQQSEKTPEAYSNEQLPDWLRDMPIKKLEPYMESVDQDITAAIEGNYLFEDPFELSTLRNEVLNIDAKRLLIAIFRWKIDDVRNQRDRRDQSS